MKSVELGYLIKHRPHCCVDFVWYCRQQARKSCQTILGFLFCRLSSRDNGLELDYCVSVQHFLLLCEYIFLQLFYSQFWKYQLFQLSLCILFSTTPVGVASLIASAILKVTNLEAVFNSLGMFVLALSVGIGFYLLVLVPLLYFIVTRNSPLYYIAVSLRAWMTVFSVASSLVIFLC